MSTIKRASTNDVYSKYFESMGIQSTGTIESSSMHFETLRMLEASDQIEEAHSGYYCVFLAITVADESLKVEWKESRKKLLWIHQAKKTELCDDNTTTAHKGACAQPANVLKHEDHQIGAQSVRLRKKPHFARYFPSFLSFDTRELNRTNWKLSTIARNGNHQHASFRVACVRKYWCAVRLFSLNLSSLSQITTILR